MNKLKLLFLLALASCSRPGQEKNTDTVGIGNITIGSDESLEPVVNALKNAFEGLNPEGKIKVLYQPEQLAINNMLLDCTRVAVVTRELTKQERKIYEDAKIDYKSYKVAVDAVAFIVNKADKDTLITERELKNLFNGKDKSKTIVVDNANSSNLAFMMNKFGITDPKKLGVSVSAVNNNKEVIEFVKKNKNAIGVIGVNWISDGDDPASMGFYKSINVLAVSVKDNPKSIDDYYLPFEYNLYLKTYPYRRVVYMITKEARYGLGTGFMNFTKGEKGQLVIQKQGILPAAMPIRLYKVQN
jgi:phosphate transport system substrate-binding protein